ncbi:MAG: gliding motility-associated C-terminal domain-containing protein [Flavobacteriia bacterium]|nr:gliding motility-associated C-terminal domain-containing protein [Flavobacteriia bacterium]
MNTNFSALLILVNFIFLTNIIIAQGESKNWYFGYNAGINFSSGTAIALNNSAMSTDEGSASISDANGNLLFYTDGVTIYDRNHNIMQNGTGLLGSPSSTQSGVIIQKPGYTNLYYIFTTTLIGQMDGLRYSEVDINLNDGLGAVTANKNILLHTPTCEKITGIRHQNNVDIWIVSRDVNASQFRSFLITQNGVDPTPVLSNIGLYISENQSLEAGQMKAYLGGKKIATATYSNGVFELFDFDNQTGTLSNAIELSGTSGAAYGVEFSPDGSKLYGSVATGSFIGYPPTENLYQWNLCAGTGSAGDIIASMQVVFSGATTDQGLASMQLAPDGKIYVARYHGVPGSESQFLGVINNPNELGILCNYVDEGFFLGGQTSSMGLPNFVPYNLNTIPPPILNFSYDSILCVNNGIVTPIFHPQFAGGGVFSCTDPNLTIDAFSGQIDLNISQIGTYNVVYNLILSACGIESFDTIVQVSIEEINQIAEFTIPSSSCVSNADITPILNVNACVDGVFSCSPGLSIDVQTGVINLSNSNAGNHIVTYTCPALFCKIEESYSTTFNLYSNSTANFIPFEDTTILIDNPQVEFINQSFNADSYFWDFGDGITSTSENPVHTFPSQAGNYLVTLISYQNGLCNDTVSRIIRIPTDDFLYVPNTFTPDGDEYNQLFEPIISDGVMAESYTLLIFNRWGEILFESHDPSIGWDGTYNAYSVEKGLYVWRIQFENLKYEKIVRHGHVLLLK